MRFRLVQVQAAWARGSRHAALQVGVSVRIR